MATELTTDYLVIGAGGMALAFVDQLLNEDANATVVMVDRRPNPGGHWNDAYDFVRLHQPAAWYGVNSAPLGNGGEDLASKPEILTHFQQAVDRFLASGRFQYFPSCNYVGHGRFHQIGSEEAQYIVDATTIVDGTYTNVSTPSTREPPFPVDDAARLVPINELTTEASKWPAFCVIGAGKTGMDAVLYLLAQGINPDAISWVIPNDAWLLDRAAFKPDRIGREMIKDIRIVAVSRTRTEVFDKAQAWGRFLCLDPDIRPTRFRCATVSLDELNQLRLVRRTIRLGRVQRIEANRLCLTQGEVPMDPDTLFVDCAANGLARRPPKPVFGERSITLQPILLCQPLYSGAVIGWAQARLPSTEAKNELCPPVPHPVVPDDYFRAFQGTLKHMAACRRRPRAFLAILRMRLCLFRHFTALQFIVHLFAGLLYIGRGTRRVDQFVGELENEA